MTRRATLVPLGGAVLAGLVVLAVLVSRGGAARGGASPSEAATAAVAGGESAGAKARTVGAPAKAESPAPAPKRYYAEKDPRRPLEEVYARDGQFADMAENREAFHRALADSGASDEPWTREARTVLDAWGAGVKQALGDKVTLSAARCFRGGCFVTVDAADEGAYRESTIEVNKAMNNAGWRGPSILTGADVRPSGRVEATWIVIRPDEV